MAMSWTWLCQAPASRVGPGIHGALEPVGPGILAPQDLVWISRHAPGLQYGGKARLIKNDEDCKDQHTDNGFLIIYYLHWLGMIRYQRLFITETQGRRADAVGWSNG